MEYRLCKYLIILHLNLEFISLFYFYQLLCKRYNFSTNQNKRVKIFLFSYPNCWRGLETN